MSFFEAVSSIIGQLVSKPSKNGEEILDKTGTSDQSSWPCKSQKNNTGRAIRIPTAAEADSTAKSSIIHAPRTMNYIDKVII